MSCRYNMLCRLMLVTDRTVMQPSFEEALQLALEGGARLIQLREKDLSTDELRVLAINAQTLCERFGADLLLNSNAEVAQEIGARGVHWPQREMAQIEYSKCKINGASVHSFESTREAETLGANYLVLGAVFPTTTHPDRKAVGLESLREIARSISLPAYAIGGINDEEKTRACLAAGAYGIAVRSAIWKSSDISTEVALFLRWLED